MGYITKIKQSTAKYFILSDKLHRSMRFNIASYNRCRGNVKEINSTISAILGEMAKAGDKAARANDKIVDGWVGNTAQYKAVRAFAVWQKFAITSDLLAMAEMSPLLTAGQRREHEKALSNARHAEEEARLRYYRLTEARSLAA